MSGPVPPSVFLRYFPAIRSPAPIFFGTYVTPTKMIPLKTPEQLRKEAREEGAAKALAILRGFPIPDARARSRMPPVRCAFTSRLLAFRREPSAGPAGVK